MSIKVEEPTLIGANCLLTKLSGGTVVLAIYRAPGQRIVTDSLKSLDELLHKLSSYRNTVLVGDINIDITPHTSDSRASEYLNLLTGHSILAEFDILLMVALVSIILCYRLSLKLFVISSNRQ